MGSLRIAACQINLKVGDLTGNKEKILKSYTDAIEAGADIAVFSELAVCGYPPEDLLLKSGFVANTQNVLHQIAQQTEQMKQDREDARAQLEADTKIKVAEINAEARLADQDDNNDGYIDVRNRDNDVKLETEQEKLNLQREKQQAELGLKQQDMEEKKRANQANEQIKRTAANKKPNAQKTS